MAGTEPSGAITECARKSSAGGASWEQHVEAADKNKGVTAFEFEQVAMLGALKDYQNENGSGKEQSAAGVRRTEYSLRVRSPK